MRVVTPTEEQLYAKLSPDLKRQVDEMRRRKLDDPNEYRKKLEVGVTNLLESPISLPLDLTHPNNEQCRAGRADISLESGRRRAGRVG